MSLDSLPAEILQYISEQLYRGRDKISLSLCSKAIHEKIKIQFNESFRVRERIPSNFRRLVFDEKSAFFDSIRVPWKFVDKVSFIHFSHILNKIELSPSVSEVSVFDSPGVLNALSKSEFKNLTLRMIGESHLSKELNLTGNPVVFNFVTCLKLIAFLKGEVIVSLENFPNLRTLHVNLIAISRFLLDIPKNLETLVIESCKGIVDIVIRGIENLSSIKNLKVNGVMWEFFHKRDGYQNLWNVKFTSLKTVDLNILLFDPTSINASKVIIQNFVNNLINDQLEKFRLKIISSRKASGELISEFPRAIESKLPSANKIELRFPDSIKEVYLGAMLGFEIKLFLPKQLDSLKITIVKNSIIFNRCSIKVRNLKIVFGKYSKSSENIISNLLYVFDFNHIEVLTLVDYSDNFNNTSILLSHVSECRNINTLHIKWIRDKDDYILKRAVLNKIPKIKHIILHCRKDIEVDRKDCILRVYENKD
jgi:hypothetical protein